MGSAQGFAGASDIDHCPGSSGVVQEIVQFVTEAEQIPFAYSTPRFPVVKERVLTPSFSQIGEEPPWEHIPAWLPAFPDPQTYAQFSTWDGRRTEPHASNFEQEIQQSKGEQSLLNFQQQLVLDVFERSTLIDPADAKAKRVAVESNPLLAAPLKIGDGEVASVAPPAKLFINVASANPVVDNFVEDKSIAVVDTYAPAMEAMKSTCDSEQDRTKLLLNKKPTVCFEIGIGNKFLGRFVGLSPQKELHRKTLPWFAMEGEKDDRKRRAEKILRESLENPDQLLQL